MKRLLSLLMIVFILPLSACFDPTVDDTDPSWEAYQQDQQEDAPAEEASPEYPTEFSLAYHKDHTLDPITCGEGSQQDVASLLYEPLFLLDEHFQPVPLLCESYSWDETGLVCTLNIRQGVLFGDGSELTAADVAASLNRAAASERYSYRLRQAVSISGSRDGQVAITLSTPNQGFISLLDIPVVKRGTESQLVPVGTGPYLFVTGSEGNYLQANSDWWQQKSLPTSTIPLVHAKDQDTAAYLFSSRRVELLTVDPTDSHISNSGQASEAERPTTILQFIGFNTDSQVFSSADARRAFTTGLQREMLTDAFLSGHARQAQFPIAPTSPLYPADLDVSYSYDATLAALDQAGCNTGTARELKLLVNAEDSFRLSCAEFVAKSLSLLDWHITVTALPWEEYILALTAGNFDLYYGEVRMTADWDLTDLIGTGGAMNYGGYTSPLTDTLLLSFAANPDRQAAARQLYSHLRDTVPIAPICFRNYTVLTHTGVVEHMAPTPGNTFAGLESWRIHLK